VVAPFGRFYYFDSPLPAALRRQLPTEGFPRWVSVKKAGSGRCALGPSLTS